MATATKERAVVLRPDEVRALLDAGVAELRRKMNPQPADDIRPHQYPNPNYQGWISSLRHDYGPTTAHSCPLGQPGDRLWCRETWSLVRPWFDPETGYVDSYNEWVDPLPKAKPEGWVVMYLADWGPGDDHPDDRLFRWRPSTRMPRWASRLTIEVESVRVERNGPGAWERVVAAKRADDPTTPPRAAPRPAADRDAPAPGTLPRAKQGPNTKGER